MTTIITVQDLIDALSQYPGNYPVIGMAQAENGNWLPRAVMVEQAKALMDNKEQIDMQMVHIVLNPNKKLSPAMVTLPNEEETLLTLQKLEH